MAHGHPDYWEYSSPQLPVPGIEQILFVVQTQMVVASGATENLCEYGVPANETLYLTGGLVTCDGPGTQQFSVRMLPAAAQEMYFDTALVFPFNPSAMMVVEAPRIIRLEVTNLDAIAHNFGGFLLGFRVTIVPGAPDPVGLGLAIQGAGV